VRDRRSAIIVHCQDYVCHRCVFPRSPCSLKRLFRSLANSRVCLGALPALTDAWVDALPAGGGGGDGTLTLAGVQGALESLRPSGARLPLKFKILEIMKDSSVPVQEYDPATGARPKAKRHSRFVSAHLVDLVWEPLRQFADEVLASASGTSQDLPDDLEINLALLAEEMEGLVDSPGDWVSIDVWLDLVHGLLREHAGVDLPPDFVAEVFGTLAPWVFPTTPAAAYALVGSRVPAVLLGKAGARACMASALSSSATRRCLSLPRGLQSLRSCAES